MDEGGVPVFILDLDQERPNGELWSRSGPRTHQHADVQSRNLINLSEKMKELYISNALHGIFS